MNNYNDDKVIREKERNWSNNADIDIDDEIDYDENFGDNNYDERIDDHDDDYDNDPEKSDKSWKFHGRKKKKKTRDTMTMVTSVMR